MIGRSNREPSARPRVQSSNRAEEELPLKTAKIGHRDTHRARPAYFPKTVPADHLSVRDPRAAARSRDLCGKAERKGGAGNLKRWERRFPFFLAPFLLISGPTLLSSWTKKMKTLLYLTVTLGETPSFFQKGDLDPDLGF